MGTEKTIEDVRHTASKLSSPSEADTRVLLIEPLLASIGWDTSDPDVVKREVETHGKFLDIALYIDGKPQVFVEAKALGKPLNDKKSVLQAVSYASSKGVQWSVLTDGLRYRVFDAIAACDLEEKLLFEFSLDPADGESSHDLGVKSRRLSPTAVSDGQLSKFASEQFADQRVQSCLQELLDQPPPALLKLIAQRLGEPKLQPEVLIASMKRIAADPSLSNVISLKSSGSASVSNKGQLGSSSATALTSHVVGKSSEIVALFEKLDKTARSLDTIVHRRVTKRYITYRAGTKPFAWVVVRGGSIQVFLQIKASDPIVSKSDRLRDVTDVGHWGGGDVEFRLTSAAQLDELVPLLELAFSSACDQA